ncbi:MAG: transglutaminase domain-containing protein [Nanoarchaeota archaeon]|nr:transglutaminase domain-containing protein [Nanoarchaeota archaeon]
MLDELEAEKKKGPLHLILGVFLIMVVLALIIPYYAVRLDPVPKYIATIEDVSSLNFEYGDKFEINSNTDFIKLLNPSDEIIKGIADRVVVKAECGGNKVCYAKSLFYFVKGNIEYVNDPPTEYVKSARETLLNGAGDCDDSSVLLANLLQSIGINTRFVFIPGHVYVEAYLPEALSKYRDNGWVALDATCQYCEFGDINYKSQKDDRTYI